MKRSVREGEKMSKEETETTVKEKGEDPVEAQESTGEEATRIFSTPWQLPW